MKLEWRDKYPGAVEVVGADFTNDLEGATVLAITAEVIAGTARLDTPPEGFANFPLAGAVQKWWVTGGEPGPQRVLVTAAMSDGRRVQYVYSFNILR